MIEHLILEKALPKRVVVLGGSGFVGRAVAAHLKGLDVETVRLSSADVDLCGPESVHLLRCKLHNGDALVFVSALTPDRGRDIRTLMKNLKMGEHVCAALGGSSCSHVVYISSDAVYADDANPVRESSYCDPASFHGLMHLTRERMLASTLAESEVPLLILRPSLLYGANDTHNGYGPNRFLSLAGEGRPIRLFGEGEEKRDHVYVEDLARLIGLGLMHKTKGVLNVATGTSVSFMAVAHMLAGQMGKDADIECLPRSQPITHRHFDITLKYQAFPSFDYTSLADGLAKTVSQMTCL